MENTSNKVKQTQIRTAQRTKENKQNNKKIQECHTFEYLSEVLTELMMIVLQYLYTYIKRS